MQNTKLWFASLACIAISTLTACSVLPLSKQQSEAGQTFLLKKAITVKAGNTRTFIQNGEVVSKHAFSRFSQHCRIELYNLSAKDVTVQPASFEIKKVYTDEELIAQNRSRILLASTKQFAFTDPEPDGVPETFDLIHLDLHSDAHKNVYRLTCAAAISDGNPLDEPDSIRPGKAQINRILGSYGEVR